MTLEHLRACCAIDPDDRRKEPCWHWTGPADRSGRPVLHLNQGGTKSARAAAYEAAKGKPLAAGWKTTYRCESKDCINPAHTLASTNAKVTARAAKRTTNRAMAHARLAARKQADSALSWDIVRELRRRCADGSTTRAAALALGVKEANASLIVRNKTWVERIGLVAIAQQAGML